MQGKDTSSSAPSWVLLLSAILGIVFLIAGMSKSLTLPQFIEVLQFDRIPRALTKPLAFSIPPIEVLLGSALVVRYRLMPALLAVSGLLIIYTVQLIFLFASDHAPACNCLGVLREYENAHAGHFVGIVRNTLLLLMAGACIHRLWQYSSKQERSYTVSNFSGKGNRETAFTIVEVLVVISIIAILIGILLPVVIRARTSAAKTVCSSNLKQLGIAAATYSSDNNGYVPRAASYWHPEFGWWPLCFGKYLGSGNQTEETLHRSQVFQCVSHPLNDIPTGFVINSYVFDDDVPRGSFIAGPSRVAQIRNTSRIAYLLEAADIFNLPPEPSDPGDKEGIYWIVFHSVWHESHFPDASRHRISDRRHGNSSNVLFFDGHVDSIVPGSVTPDLLNDGISVHSTRYSADPRHNPQIPYPP